MFEPIVFTGITPEKYNALLTAAAKDVSITPEPNGGKAASHGVTVEWTYLDETLTVTILSKPFYVPEDAVKALFESWLAEPVVE